MKRALALFFALTLALSAQQAEDQPTSMDDLTAIPQLESGEIGKDIQVSYTREQVENFLDQYVGSWKGDYVISAMQSAGKVRMTAQAQYYWELVDDKRVLKNQTVYATGDKLTHSSSLTYFWEGRLVTEVEQDDVRRIFFGSISQDGKTVNWSAAITFRPLDTATKETFAVNDAGETVMRVSGYEEVSQGNQFAYVQLKAELVKGPLE